MELLCLEQGWEPSLQFSPHPWPLSAESWIPGTQLPKGSHVLMSVCVQGTLRLILFHPFFPLQSEERRYVWWPFPLWLLLLLSLLSFLLLCCIIWKGLNLAENEDAVLFWWVLATPSVGGITRRVSVAGEKEDQGTWCCWLTQITHFGTACFLPRVASNQLNLST